jgi:signal transduction histidine kinase
MQDAICSRGVIAEIPMKISIHRKLILFSFIILAGNALLGYAIYKSYKTMTISARWVQHTEQVIYQSVKIYAVAKDIETSSRGFVITKDSTFLAPLYASGKIIPLYIGQLKQLTRDNGIQQRRIDSLDFFLHKFLIFSYKAAELRSNAGLATAVALISGSRGKYYTARIRQITNGIQKDEFVLLKLRNRTNEINLVIYHRLSITIFILMAVFTFLLLIAIGISLFQNKDKRRRAAELVVANKELYFQNEEKEKRASELVIANKELHFQNEEKEKRASELVVANKELLYQNEEKEDRAAELIIANKELLYQNEEKENRAAELAVANKELLYQNAEKENRAAELIIANLELSFQNKEKEKRAIELAVANDELLFQNNERKLAEAERIKMVNDLVIRNNDLEQFAYIISHNLRAPIANIIGASSALNDSDLSIADTEMLNNGINKSVMKLDEVVQDLNHILDVKSEVNVNKEIVVFSKLVDEIKISIKNMIDKYKIEIEYDFSEVSEILTLKPYLYSIFYNLISNSVKYRQQDVPCTVKIKSTRTKDNVQLTFADNGMGIDLGKNGDQVFGLYKRFHTNIEGKGMGLYMVKTQVETLGGRIDIKSEENKGTEFNIKLAI